MVAHPAPIPSTRETHMAKKLAKKEETDNPLSLVNFDHKTNRVYTTSYEVSKRFGKQHNYVVKAIERHIKEEKEDAGDVQTLLDISSPDFALFEGIDDMNRPLTMYAITREGFADIVANFTGAKAREWKRQFRKAFTYYEQIALGHLANLQDSERKELREASKVLRRELTDQLKALQAVMKSVQREGSAAADHVYDLWTTMIHKALFKKALPKGVSLRDWLTAQQLMMLQAVELMVANLVPSLIKSLESGEIDYKKPYHVAKEEVSEFVAKLGGPTEVPDYPQMKSGNLALGGA